jgi:hypothetical protein
LYSNLVPVQFVMSSLFSQAFNNLVPINNKNSRPIVFIDSSLVDCEKIAQQVIPRARVIIIGSQASGVKEISKILQESNCLEVHIFSAGFPGCIYLGKSELSLDTLIAYKSQLKNWFKTNNLINLIGSPHLWIYSSNLNVGDVGEEFMTKLSQITQVEIHISNNLEESKILEE